MISPSCPGALPPPAGDRLRTGGKGTGGERHCQLRSPRPPGGGGGVPGSGPAPSSSSACPAPRLAPWQVCCVCPSQSSRSPGSAGSWRGRSGAAAASLRGGWAEEAGAGPAARFAALPRRRVSGHAVEEVWLSLSKAALSARHGVSTACEAELLIFVPTLDRGNSLGEMLYKNPQTSYPTASNTRG